MTRSDDWEDRFVMRTPLLSADAFTQWGEDLQARTAYLEGGDLQHAVARDRARLRTRLAEQLAEPRVREAVGLASPGVARGITRWSRDPDRDKATRNLERALVGYFTRMTTRATPFGLLSGCSVGDASGSTDLAVGSRRDARRHVELDADAVYAMAERIGRDPSVRERDRLYTNTTVVRIGDRLCYVESRDTDAGRSYDLVSVAASEVLTEALDAARHGCRLDDLVTRIGTRLPDLEPDHVRAFVGELIDHQILQTSLVPAVTGARPGRALGERLSAIGSPHAEPLARAHADLDVLNAAPLGAGVEVGLDTYEQVRARLSAVLDADARHVFHATLHRSATRPRLDPEVLASVRRTADTLSRLAPPQASPFAAFGRAFTRRYGTRWVGLAEALNEEHGIGFGYAGRDPAPLLRGLSVAGASSSSVRLGRADRLRIALWQQAVTTGAQEVELSAEEARRWASAGRRVPDHQRAFAATFVLARGADPADPVELVFQHAAGPCGANTIARFCQSDAEIDALVRQHVAREDAGTDALVAELVHIPEGRHANVIGRPALRDYEIPYMGRASVEPARQIPVEDLEVTVRDGTVRLRSRRHGRPVLVRLTCAHDYSRSSLAVYRFLGAMARRDVGSTGMWSWGAATEAVARFVPRVRIDGVVVSLARWKLTPTDLKAVRSGSTPAARFAAVSDLRARLGLPRLVTWGAGDRQLAIDLDNSLSIDALVHGIAGDGPAELQELYPTPDRLLAHGEDGRYVAELCVPFVVPGPGERVVEREPLRVSAVAPVERRFDPGSSWLYARVYAGAAACDRVLTESLAPLMEQAQRDGLVDRWFFLRYADPDWHLRIRAHGDPSVLWRDLLPELTRRTQGLAAQGLSWKTELGTYEREVERYGGDAGIEVAEQIFAADSHYAAQCIAAIGPDQEARWHLTIAGLDTLLGALGLSLSAKLEVVGMLSRSFSRELGGESLDKQLADRFRTHRRRVAAILDARAEQGLSREHRALVHGYANQVRVPAEAMAEAAAGGVLDGPLSEVAASLLHMHVNRMVRGDARAHEAVLYDLLRRSYRSALGRARHERKAQRPRASNPSIPVLP